MRSNHCFPRPVAMLLAAVVGAFTFTCTARATTARAVANMTQTTYKLAAGANSVSITPPPNVPVFVGGECHTSGAQGVAHVSMLHITGNFLEWTGIDQASGFRSNVSGTAGTLIVTISDSLEPVSIQVASPDSFQVHNGTGSSATGSVKMIW